MRVLINKLCNWTLKLHRFKFLMVEKTALNFRFLWLKNKAEINLFENLHSFKVVEATDLISWLDFLLDNLFLCFGQGVYRRCIGTPMGTNCAVYLANFYLFTYEFDFIKCLLKSNTCPVVLHSLSLVHRFVDDLFVPDLRTSCNLTKTLLVAAYTRKPLVSWIVRLKASLVISWI